MATGPMNAETVEAVASAIMQEVFMILRVCGCRATNG